MSTAPRVLRNTDEALLHCWHPAIPRRAVSDVPVAVTVAGRPVVVVELDGRVVAFEDECPHRGVPLSTGTVVGGRLRCAYHGYCFDADGRCVDIPAIAMPARLPAKSSLRPVAVQEKWDMVWLAPRTPRFDVPDVPEFDDESFGRVLVGPFVWQAGAGHITDNFLDVSHFPFVHAGTFGTEADMRVPDWSPRDDGDGFRFGYAHEVVNPADAQALQGTTDPTQRRESTFRFFPPFGVVFRVHYLSTGVVNLVLSMTSPIDDGSSSVTLLLLGNDFRSDDAEAARAYEEKIVLEDQWMLERHPDPAMVLDPTAQFHTAADRMTVEYRRRMLQLLDSHHAPTGGES
jgi:vanillate O-demethylase monooxygenase subunit